MSFKCLLDTNILIQLEEPGADGKFRDGFSELSHFCHKHGVKIIYHPLSRTEVENDPNPVRKSKTLQWLKKYPELDHAPIADIKILEDEFGKIKNANDHVDAQILFSLKKNCADYLISQDDGLRTRASRSSLGGRTFSVQEFLTHLKRLYEPQSVFIPNVQETRTYNLDRNDEIFDSIRSRYGVEKFKIWLDKCDKEGRTTWIVRGSSELAALVIVKDESDGSHKVAELNNRVLKVCTFKVANEHRGGKLGELLLKQTLGFAVKNNFDFVYITFFAEQEYLSIFLKDFGFQVARDLNENGEFVYFKRIAKPSSLEPRVDAVDFHIKYSPWHYSGQNIKKYIVPIIPKFHEILFPELYPQQLKLPIDNQGSIPGNTLKKVYLSNSPRNMVERGSILLFYCSREDKAITSLGIVEECLKTDDLGDCMRFIGKRSVYSLNDINEMTSKKVLLIDFRLSYHLNNPIGYEFLIKNKIINGPTISITEISDEAYGKLSSSFDPNFNFN